MHDLGRSQLLATVDDCHRITELREEERFLERRVAATYDDDSLVPEEEPITSRTGRNSMTEQASLVLETEHE